jgi:CRISPR-associated protein Csm1
MNDQERAIVIGGLLHDIGKILYRSLDGRNHSQSGYEFLKNEAGIENKEILDQVRYHHAKYMDGVKKNDNSLAYLTYIADNIASAMDRRKKEEEDKGFVRNMPLESIFNILNGNLQEKHYKPMFLDAEDQINYPQEGEIKYSEGFYAGVKEKIKNCLLDFCWEDEYLNSLLSVLEATLTFIPSSTAKDELADISLYDHMKMTAAIGSCIYQYAQENKYENYKEIFLKKAKSFYEEKAFFVYSMDISGIQDFIYTINSKGALKGLRSRSFYLEIMMEHIVDELLSKLNLSRANLIYTGGGHAYLLLPNIKGVKKEIDQYEKETNQWFLDNFETALYIAGGAAECTANELCNKPEGSYKEIFKKISREISQKKLHRYTPQQLIVLNQKEIKSGNRECSICRRSDRLKEEDKCEICWALEKMSNQILYGKFYTILKKKEEISLPLPGNYYLVSDDEQKLKERMKSDEFYVRSYSKNKLYSKYSMTTKLWVGDYTNGDTFEELGERAVGIKRIAVMRADVDNLGQAFVRGFENEKIGNKYVTFSRTATFSRKLSMFFKYHINTLLKNGVYTITDKESKKRNIVIVYSGGDDVFVVGSWDDVIGFAIDLYYSLKEFSQSTLSISAGIALYPSKYPISIMAQETGKLEDAAKNIDGKNAVAIFSEDYVFHWEDFINNVVEEKLNCLKEFFTEFDERGKSFLYHMLDLLRRRNEEKINIARYAYILGRMAPEQKKDETKADLQKKNLYRNFSRQMYQWIRNEKDAKELEMAIYLFVYLKRTKEEKDGIE